MSNNKVQPENVETLRQIRSLLTDAARLTGQLSQMEMVTTRIWAGPGEPTLDGPHHTQLSKELGTIETALDQLRKRLFDLQ